LIASKSALLNNWKIWPFIQLLNFKVRMCHSEPNVQFVPLNYRLLLVNTIALGWNCKAPLPIVAHRVGYLSVVNAVPQTEQEKKDKITILVE
jgi:hypothetical protein